MATLITAFAAAQPSLNKNSSEIFQELKRLKVLGSVLYVAAHPDDENTAVLSYMNSEMMLRTGYLALTRGDGGQNLIGSEQAEYLGVIRTQELMEARKIDGAEQFFTRAIDFGYSKSAEETFSIWDKNLLLSDVVFIIRKFQPDVIITRFPTTGEGGHGQHTASAILALEAFTKAGDKNEFPEQLKYVDVWQAKRIFWNGWLPLLEANKTDLTKLIKLDLGTYNNLLGMSYTEIAALSRSMHKSQGFGATGRRGENLNHFLSLGGESADSDMFEGIDLSWNRIKNSSKVSELINQAINEYQPTNPSKSLPVLFKIYDELNKLEKNNLTESKLRDVQNLISYCAGLWIEAIAKDYSYSPGSKIEVSAGIVNRSEIPLELKSIIIKPVNKIVEVNSKLENNKFITFETDFVLPSQMKYSQPYWLVKSPEKGLFRIDDQLLLAEPENPPALSCEFALIYNGSEIKLDVPVLYRKTDPVEGEKYRPVEILPSATIKFDEDVYVFGDNQNRKINLSLRSNVDSINGKLKFTIPDGWTISPSEFNFSINKKYDEVFFNIQVTPSKNNSTEMLKAFVESDKGNSDYSLTEISYQHIKPAIVLSKAETKLIKLDMPRVVDRIGYIMGSGDDVPAYLSQLGYVVDILTDEQLDNGGLTDYDVIITGIRAYNTRQRLGKQKDKLLDYVKAGGTLIVQYTIDRGLVTDNFSPYPLSLSRIRVTDENSKFSFPDPEHRLLNYPNRITEEDFDGWVQERGLYFAKDWDKHFESVVSFTDGLEEPASGGLLYTKYGTGVFIYTGISWWRQLPAGVTGAYKFFVNLLSAGVERHSLNN